MSDDVRPRVITSARVDSVGPVLTPSWPAPDPATERVCNCTENGGCYCGDPECDIDWCTACEGELPDIPCARHTGMVSGYYRSFPPGG